MSKKAVVHTQLSAEQVKMQKDTADKIKQQALATVQLQQ